MAKFKPYSYTQCCFIPVFFNKQIQVGTLEYSINYLIENKFNLTGFDSRYNNNENVAFAYDSHILLKIVLFAYSRGITSSREIAKCCEILLKYSLTLFAKRPAGIVGNYLGFRDTFILSDKFCFQKPKNTFAQLGF